MERDAMQKLMEWKGRRKRKPLILEGARQVGKTWLMKEFGRRAYRHTAYLNLVEMPHARTVFEEDFDVTSMMRAISTRSSEDVLPGETLIILDEIQASERALHALKFLHEQAPEYHVMAAGSLLGVAMRHKHLSYPVGHVEALPLGPLSFHEFLRALGHERYEKMLREVDIKTLNVFHDTLCRLLEEYMLVGGMPEVVQEYTANHSGGNVRELQQQILDAYTQDFSKYTSSQQILRIHEVWKSIPAQLARPIGKFSYGTIKGGARGRDYEEAISWLVLCGLVRRVHRISKPAIPLPHYEQSDAFKLFLSDSGLLRAMADPGSAEPTRSIYTEFKGALTEQCVCQMLTTALPHTPLAYWTNPTGTAEVDFVLQHDGRILPIEVKATTHTQSKSLRVYCEKYAPKLTIRCSLARYGKREELLSIPLYLMEDVTSAIPLHRS